MPATAYAYTRAQGYLCPGQTETSRLDHLLPPNVETGHQKAEHPTSAQGNKGQVQVKGGGHLKVLCRYYFCQFCGVLQGRGEGAGSFTFRSIGNRRRKIQGPSHTPPLTKPRLSQ